MQMQPACTLPYPDKFEQAARFFNQYASVNPAMTTETKLLLFGLAQQAVNGNSDQPKPWAWNTIEVAKWQAWNHLKDMDKMEAMRLFVKTLEEDEVRHCAFTFTHCTHYDPLCHEHCIFAPSTASYQYYEVLRWPASWRRHPICSQRPSRAAIDSCCH